MAEASISEDQDKFSCQLCLDLLKDPVTIPCGHSFCMVCINGCWDQEDQGGVYSCPQCRETFTPRPVLHRNTMLTEVVEKLKKTELQAASADQSYTGSGDVECDFCTESKDKAVKSCLICLASYCATHIKPHYQSPAFKKHKLVEVSSNLQKNICPRHVKLFEIYCRTEQRCICSLCLLEEHKSHDTVTVEAERREKQNCAQSAVEENEKMFDKAISYMEKKCREVTELIREQQRAEVRRTEEIKQKLEQEIADLQSRTAEMEKLSNTQDPIHFLQNFHSLCGSSGCEDSPGFTVTQKIPSDEINKSILHLKKKLEEFCKQELRTVPPNVAAVQIIIPSKQKSTIRKNSQRSKMDTSTESQKVKASQMVSSSETQERKGFLKCFCKMTLDPVTVHGFLRLSDNNTVVTSVETEEKYPDHPERFDYWKQVLCKEAITGRCYWEVEWTTVGGLCISVSYKTISRKGQGKDSRFGYNNCSWSLECSPSSAFFWHNDIKTNLQSSVSSRIGVYVDHSAGTLSFYSISDTMRLLHRVRDTFTQPLYAGFWVGYKSTVMLYNEK